MNLHSVKKQIAAFSAVSFVAAAVPAHAAIIISEVSPWSSGDSSYAADWFELTNTGTTAVDITGWKVDDNSNASASALLLRGVTSIGAGQSAIFLESTASASSSDTTIDNAFKLAWFGSNIPAGFLIGNYGGSGIGFSTGGDAVNIFNASNTLITRIDFGASTTGRTFDNSAGLNNATISTLSSVGVHGAFTSANGAEIGSPGVVPLPGALPLLMSAVGLIGGMRLRRARKN
jgi:hypothetical protein